MQLRFVSGVAKVSRIRIVADEDTSIPQTRVGQDLLDGYSIRIEGNGAHIVLADVVAILATEDTADSVYDYALAVMTRLGRFYGLGLPPGPLVENTSM